MNITRALMIEPFVDDEDCVSLMVVDAAKQTHVLEDTAVYNEKEYSKEERWLLRNSLEDATWPLPGDFRDKVYDPVGKDDLADLHRRICIYLRRYVWLTNDRSYHLVANWIISTYFRHVFSHAPLLIIDGVTTSGKSTLLKVLNEVVYRGSLVDGYTAAQLAREIEASRSTMLLDESTDILQMEKGVEIMSILKSAYSKRGVWKRADPKSKRLITYHTYTHCAIAVMADILPNDIYNRGIRVGMTGMPEDLELGDIDCVDEDDDHGNCSPKYLRTELHHLRWMCLTYSEDKVPVDWRKHRLLSRKYFTEKIDGQWYYAYVHGMPKDSPRIGGRVRNVATTLCSVAQCTLTEDPTIRNILENERTNRQVTIDSPEALAFSALVDVIWRKWSELGPVERSEGAMSSEMFDSIVKEITTKMVADRYNGILIEQGNADREPVKTLRVTARLRALGFDYGLSSQNQSYLNPGHYLFKPMFMQHLATYLPEWVQNFDLKDGGGDG